MNIRVWVYHLAVIFINEELLTNDGQVAWSTQNIHTTLKDFQAAMQFYVHNNFVNTLRGICSSMFCVVFPLQLGVLLSCFLFSLLCGRYVTCMYKFRTLCFIVLMRCSQSLNSTHNENTKKVNFLVNKTYQLCEKKFFNLGSYVDSFQGKRRFRNNLQPVGNVTLRYLL